MPKYTSPEKATSPRKNWAIIKILDPGEEGNMVIAQGKWDGETVIGLRWNGTAKAPINNPQARGLPCG